MSRNHSLYSVLIVVLVVGTVLVCKAQQPAKPAMPRDPLIPVLEKIVIQQKHRIDALQVQLDQANDALRLTQQRAAEASANLATQCRQEQQWSNTALPQPQVVTVLYESSRATLNLALISLPGAPRIAIGPRSQLAPRWVIPGKNQPQLLGETRQAIYYWFDPSAMLWQGPFAPERVTQ